MKRGSYIFGFCSLRNLRNFPGNFLELAESYSADEPVVSEPPALKEHT
jgi:hypothetical protein